MGKKEDRINEGLLKEHAKKISIRDASAYSLMDGAGLRYITPYALYLGASNKFIGFLTMFPAFLGASMRLLFNKMYKQNNRKKTVVFWATFQAIFWFPLILAGLFYFLFNLSLVFSLLILIISYSGIIVSGALAAPAWSSWMQDLIDKDRGKYFSKRTRISSFIVLVSMLIAGFVLDLFKEQNIFFGFLILFSFAALGRFISVGYLKKQYEPKFEYDDSSYFSFRQFIKKMYYNNFGKYVIFVALIMFGVAIASPFFAVYMLKTLEFTYVQFTIITLSSLVSTLLFLPFWGRISDKYGNVFTFRINALFISMVPFLWLGVSFLNLNKIALVSTLVVVEIFSGFVWAGFNLSTSNFIYDAVSRQKLALCVTYFSFMHGTGALLGGLLGGWLSGNSNFMILGLTPILSIFLLSGILRLTPSIIIASKLKEVRKVQTPHFYIPYFFNLRKI